jgi:hypothetical protein
MIKEKHAMEKLVDAPPLALIAFGVTVALIFVTQRLGLFAGTNAGPEKARAAAQVATVIVDPTALNKATHALETHTAAINRAVSVAEDLTKSIALNAAELDRLRDELFIQHEVSRRR